MNIQPSAATGEVRAGVLKLHAKADDFFRAVLRSHKPRMMCGPGCASCCNRMPSVFPVEAWIAAKLLRDGDKRKLASVYREIKTLGEKEEARPCPFLDDRERCRIYEMRPIICRSHGAPILVPGRGVSDFDVCPLNFSQPGERYKVQPEDVLDVERLNEILAVVDNLFRQAVDSSGSLPLRMPLARGLLYFLRNEY